MEFFVDVAEYFPIDGFTTNPNILTKSDKPLEENLREYKKYIDETGYTVFVQVTAENAAEMFAQAKALKASFRTADEIERLAGVGCHAVTITPEFFDLLIKHPSTNESLEMFRNSWQNTFGDSQITDYL